jgi:hypothetical protein
MELRYFGWSGVTVRHGDREIAFDIPEESDWEAPLRPVESIYCVTHGHLEHCALLGHLDRRVVEGKTRLRLLSSAPIVEFAKRGTSLPGENLHVVGEGVPFRGEKETVTAFEWRHMDLVPRGFLQAIRHFGHLAAKPLEFLRILDRGSRLPRNAPTLGFHVRFPDGRTVLNYSEGLHSKTREEEVRRVAEEFRSDVLLAGVEPEDVDIMPRWISILRPRAAFLYEPHRPWRRKFGMPCLDLPRYVESAFQGLPGIQVFPLFPGQTVWVDAEGLGR